MNFFVLLFHSSHSSSPKATSIPSFSKLSHSSKNWTFHFSKFSHSSCVSLLAGIDGSHVDSSCRATSPTLCILLAILKLSSHPCQASQTTDSCLLMSSVSSMTLD